MSPEDLLREASHRTLERIRVDRQKVDGTLANSLTHLENHLFSRRLDVNQWKRACGIQEGSFTVRFHRDLDLSPKKYITQRRMETATRLLRDTDLKVQRIADLLGYSSAAVFIRAFRRWAEMPPTTYRANKRSLPCYLLSESDHASPASRPTQVGPPTLQ